MVTGCEKSYCDARSLKRHLENHHQHTSEQIAVEMVTAASQAADILAEVSAAQPTVVTHKTAMAGQGLTTTVIQASPESVIQSAHVGGQNQTQQAQSGLAVASSENNNILAQQLMIKPALNQAGATLVTLAVSVPTAGQVASQDMASQHYQQQQQQVGVAQYEALLNQQNQLQLLHEQAKIDPVKIDAKDLEVRYTSCIVIVLNFSTRVVAI